MVPSAGRGEEHQEGKPASPPHRYYTRSSREQQPSPTSDGRRPSVEEEFPKPTHHMNRKHIHLSSSRLPLSSESQFETENEGDAKDNEMSQDFMMDQLSFTTSNPIRAPFPSPAMKSTQPFYPFPPSRQGTPQQYAHSEGGWGQHQESMSWHQSGTGGGSCILVEAANRAQMAILVDDMGSMGFEPMDQT
jgi:hypothetical protein